MDFLQWLAGLLNPAPVPAPTPKPGPTPGPSGVVAALNVERARYSLPPFRDDARLAATAGAWAVEMARKNVLFHRDFAGRVSAVYPNTAAGEDIAEGATSTVGVVAMWMNSPPHRANILGAFTLAGAGHATAADGTVYWCVDFGAP
jgi:uncharacterized protein YkwD